MGDTTAISWCDHTFNLWWGCEHAPANPDDPTDTRTSPGCDNCYAERFDKRVGGDHWLAGGPRRFFGDAYWAKPFQWNAAAEYAGRRASVFCASMADWAELHRDPGIRARQDAARARLWQLIRATPWIDWLLVTKRPQNYSALLPWAGLNEWQDPWRNVWLLVTGENTEQLLRRTAILRRTPAWIRGISAEPLLEHISAQAWDEALGPHSDGIGDNLIYWLIVGDESGLASGPHKARPAHPDWVRTARDAAARHRVAFHFKQWAGADVDGITGKRGGPRGPIHLPVLDGRVHQGRPEVKP